jgi:hypothetical protein
MPACALCGTPAPPPYRVPPAEMAPDLDLRPGEPARSTLPRWVALCRGCGACAPDLAALPAEAAAITGSPAYRALTSRFLRWAALVSGTPGEAEALLQAAWEADDRGDPDAATLRRRAAAVWPRPQDAAQSLRLVDVLRRAGAFDAAAALLPALMAADETSRRIAAFQQARIAAYDTGRYGLGSALPPPARTPHVAQGKPAARGFWGWLVTGRTR